MHRLVPLAFAIVVLTAACGQTRDYFSVFDPEGKVARADLQLCGESVRLPKRGMRLGAHVPVECEGSGTIRVRLLDDRVMNCEIGYVTPGAGQSFRFQIVDDQCVAEMDNG